MSKPQILVVEDNPADVELLRLALDEQAESYELTVLRDGGEALRFVAGYQTGGGDSEPCVILLDLYLPKYDGREVLAAVRRQPSLNEIKVVILTSAMIQTHERIKMENMGAVIRQKPGNFAELVELANYVLALCKGEVEPVGAVGV